jgi:hypothetical protein
MSVLLKTKLYIQNILASEWVSYCCLACIISYWYFVYKYVLNCIGGVTVSVLASSVANHGFEPQYRVKPKTINMVFVSSPNNVRSFNTFSNFSQKDLKWYISKSIFIQIYFVTCITDCQEVLDKGHTTSGVYYITPIYSSCAIPVWCDMETPPGVRIQTLVIYICLFLHQF